MSLDIREVVEYIDSTSKVIETQNSLIEKLQKESSELRDLEAKVSQVFGAGSLKEVLEKASSLTKKAGEPRPNNWGVRVEDKTKPLSLREQAERRLCDKLNVPYKKT